MRKLIDFIFYHKIKIIYLWAILATGTFIFLGIYLWFLQSSIAIVNSKVTEIDNKLARTDLTYQDFLFRDHLGFIEQLKLNQVKAQIEQEYETLKATESGDTLTKLENIYSLYQDTLAKIDRNSEKNLSTDEVSAKLDEWGRKLLDKKYDELTTDIQETNDTLDDQYDTYLASIKPVVTTPTPTPTPTPTQSVEGYSFQSVATSRGTFSTYLIKLPLSSVTVKTLTANATNCTNECPTKSLQTYIAENNGYAGINGSYFCPPDYSSCAGKTNTYDFAVYNSNTNAWLNSNALGWDSTGVIVFNGTTPSAYYKASDFPQGAVTAGISNFPPLLVTNGQVTIDENNLTSYQKDVKGLRGALGTDDANIYLAIISGASVPDAAHVMLALGAKQVLNLDGGGSSALYIAGSYKVGPGRSLPNAIVLVK